MSKVVILGGGISGLNAGIWALKNGFEVEIIEKNPISGGLCTSWKREGATIDGCIHWITGNRDSSMNELYKAISLDELKLIKLPYFYKYLEDDKLITIDRNITKFKDQLLKYSSNDEAMIDDFIHLVDVLYQIPLHSNVPLQIASRSEFLSYLKSLRVTKEEYKYSTALSIEEYANKFNSQTLRNFFLSFMPSNYSISYFAGVISFFVHENADIYQISSKDFAHHIQVIYLKLGGKITFNQEITKININEDKIISFSSDDKDFTGDYFINAGDYYHFQKYILPEKYQNKTHIELFENNDKYPLLSCLYIAFKIINVDPEKFIHYFTLHVNGGFKCMTSVNESIIFRGYPYLKNDDGSYTLIALIDQSLNDYDLWKKAYNEKNYHDIKNKYANEVLTILLNYFSEFQGNISIIDIATPLTFERYTNTFKGCYLSHLTNSQSVRNDFNIKDEKLTNLYYASQWMTKIGGIPCALSNGMLASKYIAHDDLLKENK